MCLGLGQVRMVTGDNVITARAIAQECGILKDDGLVVEGPDFRTWDDARLDRDLEKLVVSNSCHCHADGILLMLVSRSLLTTLKYNSY